MQGTITGAIAATQTSACLAVTNSTQPTIDLRDNIFSNSQLGNASATLRFAAIALGYSTFTTLTSNYNDLYSAGAGPGTYTVGITGTVVGGTNSVTLANWQSTTTNKDANSVNVLPSFVSATDLHLTNSSNASLLAAGTAVTVTTDIDCANRGGNPDIGADQVSIAVVAVGVEYFRGTKQGTANFLDWKVNCSSDPSVRLILERSADSRTFKVIQDQNVTAARCAQGFSYTDAAPLAGINYYRLKTISPDGAFRYSMIVALINKDKGFELISVAPNPVKTNTVLSISTVKAGRMSIAVSDMTGKVVMTQNINVIAGNNPITMNLATLGAGTYNIKVINAENEVKVTRFVKY